MNSDEVRVNISRVLIAEMMNVGNTDKHTHTHTHTLSVGVLRLGSVCGSAVGQHSLETVATVSALFWEHRHEF